MSFATRAGRGDDRIAILVDRIDDDYQARIVAGARAAANRAGASVVVFSGGDVGGAPERSFVYGLVSDTRFRGVLALTGTICNVVGLSATAELLASYRPLPLCTIAGEVPGAINVTVDDASGTREVLEHLVRHHGRRRIAFVRGPSHNAEAETRYRAYREVLRENDIHLDPELVVDGDFERASGAHAIHKLLDERRIPLGALDAVAAADDLMALGAMEALLRRGVRVPEDVAVVGFDDVEECRYSTPPLTTVRQSLADVGATAATRLLDHIRGLRSELQVVMATQAVIRRSCGCVPTSSGLTVPPPEGRTLGFQAAVVQRRAIVVAELSRAARGLLGGAGSGWEQRLLHALTADLTAAETREFLKAFDQILRSAGGAAAADVCQDVITALREQVLKLVGAGPERDRAEALFHQARLLAADVVEHKQARRRMDTEARLRLLGVAAAQLVGARDPKSLAERLELLLPTLGFRFAVLGAVSDGGTAHGELDVLFAMADGRDVTGELSRRKYLARELTPTPELLAPQQSLCVMTLYSGGEVLGLLVLELREEASYVAEALRDILSASLRVIQLERAAFSETTQLG